MAYAIHFTGQYNKQFQNYNLIYYVDAHGDGTEIASIKRCSIWIERDDEISYGQDEFKVSVWVLATTWGRYEDVVTIELHVGLDILPAIRIPLIIKAITFPIEYPLAKYVHKPTIK